MMLSEAVSLHIGSSAFVVIPLIFMGGFISAFNPCCLPMIPTVVMLVSRHNLVSKWKAVFISTLFVLGFAVSMALMGALTSSLGFVFGQFGRTVNYLVAFIPLLMALRLLGILKFNLPMAEAKNIEGHFGAFLTGFLFSLVVAPCATPILASILAYAASTKSVIYGSGLLFIYGVGAGIPLIIMGSFMGFAATLKIISTNREKINHLTALLLIAVSVILFWTA